MVGNWVSEKIFRWKSEILHGNPVDKRKPCLDGDRSLLQNYPLTHKIPVILLFSFLS
jgi:hypothetical protein